MRDDGKTIFMIHHDLNTVQHYFDWVIMLNLRLVACGKCTEVFNAETINATYGKTHTLLGEALHLSHKQHSGLLET